MSKVSIDAADSPKKVTRKRAVKAVVSNDEEMVTSSPRARAATVGQTARKAPARAIVSEVKPPASKRAIKILAVVALMLIVSIWVGVSDSGQIDVNARITERNNKVINGEASGETNSAGAQSVVVPVQNSVPSVPNAGLHGRGIGTVNVPADTQVVSTSSETGTEESPEAGTGSTTVESSGEGSANAEPSQ